MKSKLIYIYLFCLALMASCQSPEDIEVTDSINGITSISAMVENEKGQRVALGTLNLENNDNLENLVIPIPWYDPIESTDETAERMKSVRLQAIMENNIHIEPLFGIVDLNEVSSYTVTYPNGEKKKMTIRGERFKFDVTQIKSIKAVNTTSEVAVSGMIDNVKNEIYFITLEDMSSVLLKEIVTVAHGTVAAEDPNVDLNKPVNLYNTVKVVVTAHNGVDSKVYTLKQKDPEKIAYGLRKESITEIWKKDFTKDGIAQATNSATTLASIGDYLIFSKGNGEAPFYFNMLTGAKLGQINKGSAKVNGSIVNDDAQNLLICDAAAAGETYNIYRTKSVTQAPTLFLSIPNTYGKQIVRTTIQGDIDGNALITAILNGSNNFVSLKVTGGVVGEPQLITVEDVGVWGDGIASIPGVVTKSTNLSDGYFIDYYDPNKLHYVDGTTHKSVLSLSGGDWAANDTRLACKEFNNATYLVLNSAPHFPQWGGTPKLFLFDATIPASLGSSISSSPSLVFSSNIAPMHNGDGVLADADVILVPSQDGYKMHLFYVDNNTKTLGAIETDCIKLD